MHGYVVRTTTLLALDVRSHRAHAYSPRAFSTLNTRRYTEDTIFSDEVTDGLEYDDIDMYVTPS